MRDRRVRLAFVVLIFALPLLIGAAGPLGLDAPPSSPVLIDPTAGPPPRIVTLTLTCATELLTLVGLLYVVDQRRRLLASA